MEGSNVKKLQSNISKFFADVREKKTEAAAYAIANEVLNIAQSYTPVDTSLLINSKFGPLIVSGKDQVKATVGFKAEYAKFVHDASGKLKGQPRAHFGVTRKGMAFGGGTGVGNYWDPDAKPKFLSEAGEEVKPLVKDILKAVYSV